MPDLYYLHRIDPSEPITHSSPGKYNLTAAQIQHSKNPYLHSIRSVRKAKRNILACRNARLQHCGRQIQVSFMCNATTSAATEKG
jgi:hypothetical protein